MNWWLAADPVEVAAQGALNVYGKNGAFRGDNCRTCPHKAKCPFFWDMTRDKRLMKLYAECEDVDNYHRDGCVYRHDADIYDTMNALVKYSNGVTMSYSLNAAMPFEGFSLAFNCEKGRLDARDYERQPFPVAESTVMYVTKSFSKREKIPVTKGEGGHDGGDNRLLDVIFRNAPMPEYMRLPDAPAGAMSCLTGLAACAINAESQVRNETDAPQTFAYRVILEDLAGKTVKTFGGGSYTLPPGATTTARASAKVNNLNFWSWGYGYPRPHGLANQRPNG
jgi:hypothetical protein